MSLMLASVTNAAEAAMAMAGGADIVDLKDPAKGALGALPVADVAAIVATGRGTSPFSAVTGDLPMQPALIVEAASAMAATGVDFVKIGLFPDPATVDCIKALAPLAGKTALVGVLFADLEPDFGLVALMAASGFKGAMLDTARKGGGRLLQHLGMPALTHFTALCRQHGLLSGLAGSLEAPDVPRLLAAAPDYLGFRGALCRKHDRNAGLDAQAFALIRALIPSAKTAPLAGPGKVDWRLLSARGYSRDHETRGLAADRIFVRDLVLPVHVGAYDFEHDIVQNVRFNIDAEVRRAAQGGDDMRDVVSYDLIRDAVQMVLSRGHFAMVETLAEEISQALLKDARILKTRVRVEKLDVIKGSVGVEIQRERAQRNAGMQELFPGHAGGNTP